MREHKYKAKPADGFPSKLEAAVYNWLVLRERNGEISEIKRQQHVELTRAKIGYRPDFSYVNNTTLQTIFVEAKGFPTEVWKLKRRLWEYYGPGPLEVWGGNHKNPTLKETVIPKEG